MDIEQSEWPALTNMLKNDHLIKVKQLDVEFHSIQHEENPEHYIKRLLVLRELYNYGFRIWQVLRNNACTFKSLSLNKKVTSCYEVGLLNMRFMK